MQVHKRVIGANQHCELYWKNKKAKVAIETSTDVYSSLKKKVLLLFLKYCGGIMVRKIEILTWGTHLVTLLVTIKLHF